MMASAVVNNPALSPEPFLDCPLASYGWLGPRISFSRDIPDDTSALDGLPAMPDNPDPADFEFRLDDPVAMLPADELFVDGKLVPLHVAAVRPSPSPPEEAKPEIAVDEAYALSPKAPRCSSRWRELLGLRKFQSAKPELQKPSSSLSKNHYPSSRSLKQLLYRGTRSPANDSLLNLPLLRDSDSESVSISSSCLSLSSSSCSGPDQEELPRLSLDSEKPGSAPILLVRNSPKVRVSRPVRRAEAASAASPPPAQPPVDSPRMNASGKVVFQGLERSSSSPGSFTGGPRVKHCGMERSYSANVARVRVSPVLNVPVCSLRGSSAKSGSVFGFGQIFSRRRRITQPEIGSDLRVNSDSFREKILQKKKVH